DDVQGALKDLQGRLSGDPASKVDPGPVTVPEPMPEPTPPTETPQRATTETGSSNGEPQVGDANAAARLVAMKLALDGTSREEARTQLAAEYEVADLDGLLDDVYSKTGK